MQRGVVARRAVPLRHLMGLRPFPAEMIAQQIGGDPVEVVLSMVVVLAFKARTKKPEIRLLEKIVGQ